MAEWSSTYNANAAVQVDRKTALRPAEPVSDHTQACLAFLQRVESVQITGGSKKEFEITVQLNADENDPESKASSFSCKRTAEEVATLQRLIVYVCTGHASLALYSIPPCALCEQFHKLEKLPWKTKHRLVHSTESIHKTMASRLRRFVEGAVVPPTNAELYCEALQRVPSAVASFLLRGVDQTKL